MHLSTLQQRLERNQKKRYEMKLRKKMVEIDTCNNCPHKMFYQIAWKNALHCHKLGRTIRTVRNILKTKTKIPKDCPLENSN